MVNQILRLFGDSNQKQVKRLSWVIPRVNDLEPRFEVLTEEELQSETESLRSLLSSGQGKLDDLIPTAFALVREASKRSLGLRHFDVQLLGGLGLHQGKVAEMKTGEGKTLVATLAVYLNALEGKGVHLVTVNDYLARRDTVWMGAIYHLLGLSVACLQHESAYIYKPNSGSDDSLANLVAVSRKDAYQADITYGTNNEFGFDYLRDNMCGSLDQQVQRPLNYAIVDEVDNILIDEARTPLIISGPAQESSGLYRTFSQLVTPLKQESDYRVEEKERQAMLTEEGIAKVERALKIDNLYDPANADLTHYVENALRARVIYQKDRDYVVDGGQVVIVDEFTGRVMPGRRYSDGLHQALEAKEGVEIQRETMTYATITLQNYFRMYPKLAGMTGTAVTEAEEFYKVYKLDVIAVPTHMPMIRDDLSDLIYKTEGSKFKAVVDDIADVHQSSRPVLVGTVSIERSEMLSSLLRRRGIPHEVLNAKNHEAEAQIIARAGRLGAVTVSTNMAGRGTDIILGGDPKDFSSKGEWAKDNELVVSKGGLYVLGTERHESRRIDNQLRGRSGRQGDPGSTRFYGSLEDDILRRFGGGMMGRMVTAAMPDDQPLESGLLTKTVEMTQSKVEAHYFDIRKHLVEYDDVVNRHRDIIYAERAKILSGADLRSNIHTMVYAEISDRVASYLVGDPTDWDVDALSAEIASIVPNPSLLNTDFVISHSPEESEYLLRGAAEQTYFDRENQFGPDVMRELERIVMLQVTDRLWVQHLTQMSNLRQGIGLYAYGQRDPLVMYKKEGHQLFSGLNDRIQYETARTIFHVVPSGHSNNEHASSARDHTQTAGAVAVGKPSPVISQNPNTVITRLTKQQTVPPLSGRKVGRNDPCHCGSGKKFKRCHGAAA